MSRALPVSTADFRHEVIEASATQPVLVDFWAPWCGPCRMLGPVLDQLAAEIPQLKVVKLNTDEEPEIAGTYSIRSIPAVKLFRNGAVVDEFVGAQPLGAVRKFVEPYLSEPSEASKLIDEAKELSRRGQANAAERLLQSLTPAAQSEPAVKRGYALVYFARLALAPDETDAIQSTRVAAARHLLHDEHAKGLELLFAAAERNRRYANAAGKEDLRKALDLLPGDDAQLPVARRRLAALLH